MGATEVLWRRIQDDLSFELARIDPMNFHLAGTVLVAQNESPMRIEYAVHCDDRWRTLSASIDQTFRGDRSSLRLDHDGGGNWTLDGAAAPYLAGCRDVDLGITPSTNALAINRLGLEVGSSSSLRAAWIRFPSLEVVPADQSYSRLTSETYEYRNVSSRFQARLEVDHLGLPVRYGGVWSRIAEGPAAGDRPGDDARALST